jgi:regulator of RNase E activity RraA
MTRSAQEVVAILRRVRTGTLQDGLDTLGLFHQSLAPEYRMVSPPRSASGFVGPAKVLVLYALDEPVVPPFENSVKLWRFFEGHIHSGDVIATGYDGPIAACELVGGMLATLFERQGAVGWLGSYVRDLCELAELEMGFVAMGAHPAIARGRVGLRSKEAPATIGGVEVASSDYVAADADGTVIVPARDDIVDGLCEFVEDYVERERAAHRDMEAGVPMSEVIDRHRIL